VRAIVLTLLLASTVPSLVLAQIQPFTSVERGSKIRLTSEAVPQSESVARFESVSGDSIHFRPLSHPVTRSVSLSSVRSIEVSRISGTRRSEYVTLLAIAGGVIGYISSNHNGTGIGTGHNASSQNAMVGAVAGVAIGGALGWWYGGKRKVETWYPVAQ
jgi:hypothetical protein